MCVAGLVWWFQDIQRTLRERKEPQEGKRAAGHRTETRSGFCKGFKAEVDSSVYLWPLESRLVSVTSRGR